LRPFRGELTMLDGANRGGSASADMGAAFGEPDAPASFGGGKAPATDLDDDIPF